jgi:type VI protein secretion system component VasK
MAKKRKTSQSRKASRPKTGAVNASARRQPARPRKGGDADPLHVVAALLVLLLVGLGIYLYQANHQQSASLSGTAPVAMEK